MCSCPRDVQVSWHPVFLALQPLQGAHCVAAPSPVREKDMSAGQDCSNRPIA